MEGILVQLGHSFLSSVPCMEPLFDVVLWKGGIRKGERGGGKKGGNG